MTTRILRREEVAALLTPALAIEAVEEAFAAHGTAASLMPPKVYLDLPQYDGDFRAMPAYLEGASGPAAGVKWVNSHPQNPGRHQLPAVLGTYILSDPVTALPLAIMDATYLTAARTGAAAAVASKHLAAPGAKSIGFVGCGVQARTMLAAHRQVFQGLEVLGADAREDVAESFAKESGGRAASLQEACAADLVCTSTPVRSPVVLASWLRPGSHINAMGADGEGKQELETGALTRARVFVDEWEQASHSGEINVPLHEGRFRREDVAGTLGEVIAGRAPGRSRPDDITLFDSTGLALQDLACAQRVFEAAVAAGAGLSVDLV